MIDAESYIQQSISNIMLYLWGGMILQKKLKLLEELNGTGIICGEKKCS